jgi:hypothetical protein
MTVQLGLADVDRLTVFLSERAAMGATATVGPEGYFRDIVRRTPLPRNWIRERIGGWSGNADVDARDLVQWAMSRGTNPAKPTWTTLGSLLQTTLQDAGLEEASLLVAFISAHRLCLDSSELEALRTRYGVPEAALSSTNGPPDTGPEIEWRGPSEVMELQSWIKPEPPLLDVGFLQMAILRAASVCRVELPSRGRRGTGVLIWPDLVLTNYHVLKSHAEEHIEANVQDTLVRFGYVHSESGQEAQGQVFAPNREEPIARSNETLDYVLLRVESRIRGAQDIQVAPITKELPERGSGLSILQHFQGEAMKLAISSNGVTGVYEDLGLIQYVTAASKGSSGSPCFNDRWEAVAIHHAERGQSFGRIREGILLRAILREIGPLLR